MSKLFLSYSFQNDAAIVQEVAFHLERQFPQEVFCAPPDDSLNDESEWRNVVMPHLRSTLYFVFFLGSRVGPIQRWEAEAVTERGRTDDDRNAVAATRIAGTNEPGITPPIHYIVVQFSPQRADLPECLKDRHLTRFSIDSELEGEALRCAWEIVGVIGTSWLYFDGLPNGCPYDYEKEIIKVFDSQGRNSSLSTLRAGCPANWPTIPRVDDAWYNNPIPPKEIGELGNDDRCALVAANQQSSAADTDHEHVIQDASSLSFPEARPRKRLCFPRRTEASDALRNLTVGIVVTGGIAPGINAVVGSILERHRVYKHRMWPTARDEAGDQTDDHRYRFTAYCFRDGLKGILDQRHLQIAEGAFHDPESSPPSDLKVAVGQLRAMSNEGGSFFGTSRMDALLPKRDDICHERSRVELLERIVAQLVDSLEIDILYVVGGDGGMRAAQAISNIARDMQRIQLMRGRRPRRDLTVVGIPKAMDNDILWVWQSFGFLSAVEQAKEYVLQMHTEVKSNPRLCIMQLFGSESGFVVSHAALGSGVCDVALIPEVRFSMRKLASYIFDRLVSRHRLDSMAFDGGSPHGMILMAETAVPTDYHEYLDGLSEEEKKAIYNFVTRDNRRVQGQTPDELRTGSLKIVARGLQSEIRSKGPPWQSYRIVTSEPRYLLRSLPPGANDVIYAQRLGALAVDNAMAGYTDFMVSQWLTEYVLVPLPLVTLGRKRVPPSGIFWRSVVSDTDQGDLGDEPPEEPLPD